MNTKAVVPLALAVVLGLVAAILVRNAIAHHGALPTQASNLVTVMVAKENIDPGTELNPDLLVPSKVAADSAPGQVFSDPTQLHGRVLIAPLVKGQTVLETLLAPTGTGGGLQALVPPGMRAITIDINEVTGVGGMLIPGCRVDILTAVHDAKTNENFTRTILQNMKVTAVGRAFTNTPPPDGQPAPPPANNITLLCTPHQAQVIQLACINGKPWFVLRSSRDGIQTPLEGTTLAELRGDDSNADATPGAQATADPQSGSDGQPVTVKRIIQVLRGGAETNVTFVTPASRVVTSVDTGPVGSLPVNQ